MIAELDVLKRLDEGLERLALPYMLTGSFAMAHYAVPRMTRDIDIVVAIADKNIDDLVREFSDDFYLDADAARDAVRGERLFNMMHLHSGVKVDLIVRKSDAYRLQEFERRINVELVDVKTWLVSKEDLILSKLVWSSDTRSELQRRDVVQLLSSGPVDLEYLSANALRLGVSQSLKELLP
jgi:hypothetical protein